MTDRPSDAIDPFEPVLTRRVRAFTDQAVLPIDPTAIARAAALARGPGLAGRLRGPAGSTARLGWILAAGLLAVAAVGTTVIGGGSNGFFAPGPTPTASPPPNPVGVPGTTLCDPNVVEGRITAWEGAAGHRIATVELRNAGDEACWVASLPEVWLVDRTGEPLLVGKAQSAPVIQMAPGDVLHTLVQAGNYCGRDPVAPVTVAFVNGEALYVAEALTPTDVSGVPPCSGTAGPTDDIQMQPWQRERP